MINYYHYYCIILHLIFLPFDLLQVKTQLFFFFYTISSSARASSPWNVSQSSNATPSTYGLSATKTSTWQFPPWTASQTLPTRQRAAAQPVALSSRCHLIFPSHSLFLPCRLFSTSCCCAQGVFPLICNRSSLVVISFVLVETCLKHTAKDTANTTGYVLKRKLMSVFQVQCTCAAFVNP